MGSGRTTDAAACRERLLALRPGFLSTVVAGLFLCAASALAQIPVSASRAEVPAGGQFTLTFTVSQASADAVTVEEPAYPDGIQKTGGPLIRPSVAGPGLYRSQQPGQGQVAGKGPVEIQLAYAALRPGRYILGPFTCRILTTDGPARAETTEPVVIAVTDPARGNTVPPDVRWIVSDTGPHVGQTIFLQLALADVPQPLLPEKIAAAAPPGGVFEEVHGLGRITSNRYGSTELFQVPIATYFFTPTTAGAVSVPAASVTVNGSTVMSKPVEINVSPLPAAVQSSGAVGSYTFTASVANPEITEGDSFDVTLRVDGTGNLSYFKFPELSLPDMVVTSSTERSRYVPTELGYTGYREALYQLTPRAPGVTQLRVPAFSWLDPATGNTRAAAAQTFKLTTDPAAISAAQPGQGATAGGSPAEHGSVFSLLTVAQIHAMEPLEAYRDLLNYLWLLPGILVLAAAYLLRRRKGVRTILPFLGSAVFFIAAASAVPFPDAAIKQGIAAFQANKVDQAISDFTTALQARPHSPGVLYNLSLTNYQAGRHAEAIYALTNAVRFRPENGLLRKTLDWMETRLSLTRQIDPARSVNPDLMLIITAILFNLTCVLVAVSGNGKGGKYVIVLVFAVLLTLSSAGGLVYAARTQHQELGVIGRGTGNLLKIPRPDASRWIELPAGTTVDVLLDSNGFYLIRTGYGVEGWIPSNDLLYDVLPAGPTP